MNIFRLAGDVSHLVAIIILLLKIWRSKSCAGRLTLATQCGCYVRSYQCIWAVMIFHPR